MARVKRRPQIHAPNPIWLITFADLVTLLLTFFVLLLSMSSLTLSSFAQVESFFQPRNFISHSDSGNIPRRIELVLQKLLEPDFEQNKARIKDLLFPYDAIPKEMSRSKVMDNLDILVTDEGIVIVMTNSILFEQGEFELSEENKQLLTPLYEVLLYSNQDINISAHTDNLPVSGLSNYSLSSMRALSIIDFFLTEINIDDALIPQRISISAYGPDRPVADNNSPGGRAKNRRVEILLKYSQWLGGYN